MEFADVMVSFSAIDGIDQRLLRQALAIVERAGHFERRDVLSERGELFFLRVADAPGGIQDHDADAGDSEKRLRHRASRVARRRHDDGELLARFLQRNIPSGAP